MKIYLHYIVFSSAEMVKFWCLMSGLTEIILCHPDNIASIYTKNDSGRTSFFIDRSSTLIKVKTKSS